MMSCLIVDASNIFIRHYAANPAMNENGEQIGGIVGFMNNLFHMFDSHEITSIIVVWEGGGSSRKRGIYPDYKKGIIPMRLNRYYEDDIPDSLKNRTYQVRALLDLLSVFPAYTLFVEDIEADDAIGYITSYVKDEKIILSSDHDYYQLISEDCIVWSPNQKKYITLTYMLEDLKISPQNFALAKSIAGDNSDNIEGVKRVSYKTLSKYTEFKDSESLEIDDLFAIIDRDKKNKKIKSILSSRDIIKRNMKLVSLDMSVGHETIKKIKWSLSQKQEKNKLEFLRRAKKFGILHKIDLVLLNKIFEASLELKGSYE